jgi:histidyl-tRNA synthetase
MKHASLPGFRDFHPEDLARRNQIFAAWRDVARRYGFEEYDGPPLETLELYVEKSGPEIVQQLFNFTDKGGREVSLRPEMTPTLVRMLGAKIKGLPRPVRWFTIPQLFRYEKQQRGRLREHFQLNMDIVGDDSILADADLVAAALDVQRSLGLTSDDVVARISDRRLLQEVLLALGVREESLPVAYNVIDKVERDPRELCMKRLEELGLDKSRAEAAVEMTSLSLDELQLKYGANPRIAEALERLRRYFSAVDALGFGGWVKFDLRIVRGLAYYTGIVFEIFDRKGELRAVCGGGRYDNLFSGLAGIDVPSLGFGMGDVVLGELLKDRQLFASAARNVDVFVIAVNADVESDALRLVSRLRASGRSVVFSYKAAGVGKGFKAATTAGAREAIVIGPDEIAANTIVVKDLASGNERRISVEEYLR